MLGSVIRKLTDGELTPEERELYSDKLEYINSRVESIKSLSERNEEIVLTCNLIEQQSKKINETVLEREKKYKKLETAMDRLNKAIDNVDSINEDLKTVWKRLNEVEELLNDANERSPRLVKVDPVKESLVDIEEKVISFKKKVEDTIAEKNDATENENYTPNV